MMMNPQITTTTSTYRKATIMDIKEKAHAVALAKLLGCTLPDTEIIEKYTTYYQEAFELMEKELKPGTVGIVKRTF